MKTKFELKCCSRDLSEDQFYSWVLMRFRFCASVTKLRHQANKNSRDCWYIPFNRIVIKQMQLVETADLFHLIDLQSDSQVATRVQGVRIVLWAARLVEGIWSILSEKCVHVLPYIGLHNTSSAYNWSILDKSLILRLTAIVFWPQQLVATTLIWRNMAPHFLRVHANVRIYIYIAIS